MWDYDFQIEFSRWLHLQKAARRTCCLVGIRTQESYNRWRTIYRGVKKQYKNCMWSTEIDENVYNLYPLYDWKTEDIWVANGKFGWDYNKLYDLYYQAGVSLDRQRVASPFISEAIESLALYKVIDPDTWGEDDRARKRDWLCRTLWQHSCGRKKKHPFAGRIYMEIIHGVFTFDPSGTYPE